MAGLYFHIPFCKQACIHCHYPFTLLQEGNDTTAYIQSLEQELQLQEWFFQKHEINTLYFGGGTPSLLSYEELQQIFALLTEYCNLNKVEEITLEANPDDLNSPFLRQLNTTPVNRLSIGVQSFADVDLQFLNRPHTAQQSLSSIKKARSKGFTNISIDLLFGLPSLTATQWKTNIETCLALSLPHVTCYELTAPPATPLQQKINEDQIQLPSSSTFTKQYQQLTNSLTQNGYEHYEVSNFCQPNSYSLHMFNYWRNIPYLGIGVGARSLFKRDSQVIRQQNTRVLSRYVKKTSSQELPGTKEYLTKKQQFHEYLIHSLHTSCGGNLHYIRKNYGEKWEKHTKQQLKECASHFIRREGAKFFTTPSGTLQIDHLLRKLFIE